MNNKTKERVRLIHSDQKIIPIGSCGNLINFDNRLYIIFWDNWRIEIRDSLESNTYFADIILDGYSLLTMDDVLNLSIQNFETLNDIKDKKRKKEILNEYKLFIQPLKEKIRENKMQDLQYYK